MADKGPGLPMLAGTEGVGTVSAAWLRECVYEADETAAAAAPGGGREEEKEVWLLEGLTNAIRAGPEESGR